MDACNLKLKLPSCVNYSKVENSLSIIANKFVLFKIWVDPREVSYILWGSGNLKNSLNLQIVSELDAKLLCAVKIESKDLRWISICRQQDGLGCDI